MMVGMMAGWKAAPRVDTMVEPSEPSMVALLESRMVESMAILKVVAKASSTAVALACQRVACLAAETV